MSQLLGAFAHVNYNQDGDTLNACVMAVTLAGVQDGLWAVEGGNQEMCRGLLGNADVALHHQAVTAVQRLDQASWSSVEYQVSAGSGEADVFDAVVIATPLQHSRIELNGFPHSASTMHRGEYQRTVVTFVVGQPSNEYFGLDASSTTSFPTAIAVSTPAVTPFSCIGIPGSTIHKEPAQNESVEDLLTRAAGQWHFGQAVSCTTACHRARVCRLSQVQQQTGGVAVVRPRSGHLLHQPH